MTTHPRDARCEEQAVPLDLAGVRRDALASRAGVRYRDFKPSLTPRYGIAWLHLFCGHAALILTTAGLVIVWHRWQGLAIPIILVGACLYGYALAYIVLFFHEAAHYNMCRDRALNDRLANVLIGLFLGQSIAAYRSTHFDHHRYLGQPADTEHAYFDPLNVTFIAESLTGLKTLKRLAVRHTVASQDISAQLVLGSLLNLAMVAIAVRLGQWPLALAWTIGLVIVFPFLAAIRQLLEHRSEQAAPGVDYSVVPHGAVNRIFGSGLLASTFGGAGFNRHMLHHWEPQISYTRLHDLERFLLDTPAAPIVEQRTTSYSGTFLLLLRRGRGH
jgi:fatty acid desaturase